MHTKIIFLLRDSRLFRGHVICRRQSLPKIKICHLLSMLVGLRCAMSAASVLKAFLSTQISQGQAGLSLELPPMLRRAYGVTLSVGLSSRANCSCCRTAASHVADIAVYP
jgi:hypothetical protein